MPARPSSRRRLTAIALAVATPLAVVATSAAPASAAYQYGSPAERVRVDIAEAFQGHDALAAIAQSAHLVKGARLGAAADAVVATSRQQLAKAVGGYSPASAAFRDAVSASDRAKLQYAFAVNGRSGSAARSATAQSAVTAAGARVVTTLHVLVPGVPAASLRTLLTQQDARDAAATRALGARSPQVYALVEAAHLGTSALAREVALGVDLRASLPGSAVSPAADQRAFFVGLAAGHPIQVGLWTDAGLTYGVSSPAYAAAGRALETNTAALTAALGGLSSPANAATFNAQWHRHLRDYAQDADGFLRHVVTLRSSAAIDLGAFDRANAPQWVAVSGIPYGRILPQLNIHTGGTSALITQQALADPRQFASAAMGTRHFAGFGDAIISGAQSRRR